MYVVEAVVPMTDAIPSTVMSRYSPSFTNRLHCMHRKPLQSSIIVLRGRKITRSEFTARNAGVFFEGTTPLHRVLRIEK